MKISLSKFFQLRTNVYLCRNLGWQYALAYIQFLGKLYFFFNRSERKKIRQAVGMVFAKKKKRSELKAVTRRVFQGIFSHYYEKLFNVYTSFNTANTFYRTHIEDYGLSAIRKGLSKGNGVLLITGHYGGVEFIPGYLSVNNIPVSIIVKFSTDQLRRFTLKRADEFSTKIIDANKCPNIMTAVLNDLKSNRVVVTQCDEIDEWRPSSRLPVSFLGKVTGLDRTMNVLIKRSRSATVFGLMHRKTDHRYRFVAVSGEDLNKKISPPESMSLGAAALIFLEQYIYKYPEVWYQWKKYSEIPPFKRPESMPENATPVPLLNPSLG